MTLAPAQVELDVRPLTGSLGAEIRGVDLHEPLDGSVTAALRDLWLRHKVVFLPEQHLEPHHQVAFAHSFGRLTKAHPHNHALRHSGLRRRPPCHAPRDPAG